VTFVNDNRMHNVETAAVPAPEHSRNFVLQVQNCFSQNISVIISNKILLISARGSGETL